jgi:hypothetical protein
MLGRTNYTREDFDRVEAAIRRASRRLLCSLRGEASVEINPLEEYFRKGDGRLIHKWLHYFDIYDRHFAPYRRQRVTVLEIGVYHGGSLQMWKHYFGHRARIVGVDIDPRCAAFAEDRIDVVIGDQADRDFLQHLIKQLGPVDIVIDDGGHTMHQQITAFEELWPSVRDGGLYLVEDLHTSYWPVYGGGHKRAGTFIEYLKDLIDQLHAWHTPEDEASPVVDAFTRSVRGIHIYDSVVVVDKARIDQPQVEKRGTPSFDDA